jgi:hypothetical protein
MAKKGDLRQCHPSGDSVYLEDHTVKQVGRVLTMEQKTRRKPRTSRAQEGAEVVSFQITQTYRNNEKMTV